MTNISSKLFNEQVMSSITKLDERIADLQRQTSTGKRNVTFSDNPIDQIVLLNQTLQFHPFNHF